MYWAVQPGDVSSPAGSASAELVEAVAAAFHTLTRSWRYSRPIPDASELPLTRPLPLDPWLVVTTDPRWASARGLVDLAGTPWHALPGDWVQRYRELARVAADPVVEAVSAGCTPAELDTDEVYLASVATQLRRPWLTAPRVLFRGEVLTDVTPETLLARVAVQLYAVRLVNGPSPLGEIPAYPIYLPGGPLLAPAPGDEAPKDDYSVTLHVYGDELDPDDVTQLLGHAPDWSNRRGELQIGQLRGSLHRPYPTGQWRISSEHRVRVSNPTLDDHLVALLSVVEPSIGDFAAYIDRHRLDVVFSTFYAQVERFSEWSLTADTMRRMARLRARLVCGNYVVPDDAPPAGDDF